MLRARRRRQRRHRRRRLPDARASSASWRSTPTWSSTPRSPRRTAAERIAQRRAGLARGARGERRARRRVTDESVLRPGPRIGEGLATLARALHPDVAIPYGVHRCAKVASRSAPRRPRPRADARARAGARPRGQGLRRRAARRQGRHARRGRRRRSSVRGDDHPYVSRGGVKLAGALDAFGVDPRGNRCLDLGASTGGFTDCLLQRGAARSPPSTSATASSRTSSASIRASSSSSAPTRETLTPDADRRRRRSRGRRRVVHRPRQARAGDRSLPRERRRARRARQAAVRGRARRGLAGQGRRARSRGARRAPSMRRRADVEAAGFELLGTCDSTLEGPKGNLEAFVHARKP